MTRGDFYRNAREVPKSPVSQKHRACENKDQTLKRFRTLQSSDKNNIIEYEDRQYLSGPNRDVRCDSNRTPPTR